MFDSLHQFHFDILLFCLELFSPLCAVQSLVNELLVFKISH